MSITMTCRSIAALTLAAGVFFALPGCAPKAQPKGDKKDKKDDTPPTPLANANPNTPTVAKTPEKIDTTTGAGKDAIDFLTAVGSGTAKASQLSAGFVKAIGLPAELPSEKEKGYSPDAAESWLRKVGVKLTGMGPMSESSRAGDVAVFRGMFTGGTYSLRVVNEGGAWKADWLSMSSVNANLEIVGSPSGDDLLRGFAAAAIAAAICDKDAMPQEQRIAIVAAGMTPALRKSLADPFDGDKAKGLDYSPAKLGVKIAEIGSGAESLVVSPLPDGSVKVEVTKAGGAKSAYTLKLVKGATLGQWLVESITPA